MPSGVFRNGSYFLFVGVTYAEYYVVAYLLMWGHGILQFRAHRESGVLRRIGKILQIEPLQIGVVI